MAKKIDKQIEININPIKANSYYTCRVAKHSNTAGRIYLPVELAGKNVIIIPLED